MHNSQFKVQGSEFKVQSSKLKVQKHFSVFNFFKKNIWNCEIKNRFLVA